MSKEITEAFGLEYREVERPPRIISSPPQTISDFKKSLIENKRKDYTIARDNLLNLLQDMSIVVDKAVESVVSDPSARMFESFSTLVRTFSDVNKDLLSLNADEKEEVNKQASESSSDDDRKQTNNIIFVGTSDTLIDRIKEYSQ